MTLRSLLSMPLGTIVCS